MKTTDFGNTHTTLGGNRFQEQCPPVTQFACLSRIRQFRRDIPPNPEGRVIDHQPSSRLAPFSLGSHNILIF